MELLDLKSVNATTAAMIPWPFQNTTEITGAPQIQFSSLPYIQASYQYLENMQMSQGYYQEPQNYEYSKASQSNEEEPE